MLTVTEKRRVMRHYFIDRFGQIVDDTDSPRVLGTPTEIQAWMKFPGELYVEQWIISWDKLYGSSSVYNRVFQYLSYDKYGNKCSLSSGSSTLNVSEYPFEYPFTFKEVEQLINIGWTLPEGLPLRVNECKTCLTDGYHRIPLRRPRYAEWRRYEQINALKSIPEKDWELMLSILEGKPFKVIETLGDVRELVKRERQSIKQAERREKRIAAFAKGQCLSPAGIKEFEVGEGKFLYAFEVDGKPRFAVDSPAYGVAAWFFGDRQVAEAWALREITFDQARQEAIARITHHKGWEQKTAQFMPSTEELVAVP